MTNRDPVSAGTFLACTLDRRYWVVERAVRGNRFVCSVMSAVAPIVNGRPILDEVLVPDWRRVPRVIREGARAYLPPKGSAK